VEVFKSQAAVTKVGSVVLVSTVKLAFWPATHETPALGIKTVLLIFMGKLDISIS
jgi:hypothetical protein